MFSSEAQQHMHGVKMDLDETPSLNDQAPEATGIAGNCPSECPRSEQGSAVVPSQGIAADSTRFASGSTEARSTVCARHFTISPEAGNDNSNYDRSFSSVSELFFPPRQTHSSHSKAEPSLPSTGGLGPSLPLSPAIALRFSQLPVFKSVHMPAEISSQDLSPGKEQGPKEFNSRGTFHQDGSCSTQYSAVSASFPSTTSPSMLGTSMGGLSFSKRKHPPAWPTLPRVPDDRPSVSHRTLLARSAGLPASKPIIDKMSTASHLTLPSPRSPSFSRSSPRSHGPHPYQTTPKPSYPAMPATAPLPPRSTGPLDVPTSHLNVRPRGGEGCSTLRGTLRLRNVSQAWIIKELHTNAPSFWHSPGTADCKLVVPRSSPIMAKVFEAHGPDSPRQISAVAYSNPPGTANKPKTGDDAPSLSVGRAGSISVSQPDGGGMTLVQEPVTIFQLHQDYLMTQSRLLRKVLISRQTRRSGQPCTAVVAGDPALSLPSCDGHLKGAQILSQQGDDNPVVYLPLPDPSSFAIIIHWLYWGDATVIEDGLSTGKVLWKGLVHNIDYLDLDDSIKRVVGRWWRKWVKVDRPRMTTDGHLSSPYDPWVDDDDDGRDPHRVAAPTIDGGDGDEDSGLQDQLERPHWSLVDDEDLINQLKNL